MMRELSQAARHSRSLNSIVGCLDVALGKFYLMREIQMLKIAHLLLLIIAVIAFSESNVVAFHQFAKAFLPFEARSVCQQTERDFAALLAEADKHKYVVRRVEFANNQYTRDYKLRRRVVKEGAMFTQASMMKSLNNLRKLKYLKSAKLGKVALDRENKFIDIIFEVEENEKAKEK